MASNPTNATLVKRACDSCHRRKVKCIGEGTAPCKNCASSGLYCTYLSIPQKKGPKGGRAKVLSELRENQRIAQLAAGFPSELGVDGRVSSFAHARTPGLLPATFVESCIEFFCSNVYPSEPILSRQKAQDAAVHMEHSTEAYCLIAALCAFVIIQTNMEVPANVGLLPEMAHMMNLDIGYILLEESVRVRRGYDYRENPTHLTVLTSWLYYTSYFGLAKENTAWAYLREATTQTILLGLNEESSQKLDPLGVLHKRVLFWALFMAERDWALQKHRPLTLSPTIHTLDLDETTIERPIVVGYKIMINLFQIIDDTYVNLWNRVLGHTNHAWITRLHTRISEAVPVFLECTETQAVLIRVTQQWLRVQTWQLCVCQGLVSSVANDPSMALKYPVEISRDLLTTTHQFAPQAMEVHGAGLTKLRLLHSQRVEFVEKQSGNSEELAPTYSIAGCLMDVVAFTSISPEFFSLGPRDYISRLVTLISSLRRGRSRYLPPLLAKLAEVLPQFPLPQSLKLPETVSPSSIAITAARSGGESSSVDEDQPGTPAATFSTYQSTELFRRLAAQTGTQLPFTMQQSMLSPPTSHVENLSIYDSPHGTTNSPTLSHRSNSAAPATFESPLAPSSSQIVGHSGIQGSSSRTQLGHLQGHHVGTTANTYDPRYPMQEYSADHNMTPK